MPKIIKSPIVQYQYSIDQHSLLTTQIFVLKSLLGYTRAFGTCNYCDTQCMTAKQEHLCPRIPLDIHSTSSEDKYNIL
ncbi:hypothetical protein VNO78_33664 [Psophocarpus tetragonolobus]|uniref:Uncharacterized protein n=1 Tax=Psophocarpus tetragonolobus TaxID=3891 RepID=A0AAN9RSA7_PSOTE